jgi:hypothetical protein
MWKGSVVRTDLYERRLAPLACQSDGTAWARSRQAIADSSDPRVEHQMGTATGHDVEEIELSVRELEERIARPV